MSKEALRILRQIWEQDEQYNNNDNHVAFVAEALDNPVNKEGISQGPTVAQKTVPMFGHFVMFGL